MSERIKSEEGGGTAVAAKLQFRQQLESLVGQFERDSLTLPPGESHLKDWSHRALELAKELRSSNHPGKGRLHRDLQRFQVRLREMRVARRRYREQREFQASRFSREAEWADDQVALPRHRLADAVHFYVGSAVDDSSGKDPPSGSAVANAPTGPPEPAMESATASSIKPLSRVPKGGTAARQNGLRTGTIVRESTPAVYQRHSTRLDPIMAIEGRLALANSFEQAREIARAWLRKKRLVIPGASPNSFEIESANRLNRAIAVDWPGVWAMQVETADTTTAGRRWRVEMVLVEAQPTPAVSVTLTAISPANQPAPQSSIPGLLSKLIEEIGLLDHDAGEELFAGPTVVNDLTALKLMLTSLHSSARRRPALVLSTYNKLGRSATLLDPAGLATRLRGVAKVYVLSREMSWALTDAVSKRFAVAGAAVRMFRPGFTPDDEPSLHPAWNPEALRAQGLNLTELTALFLHEAADVSLRALEREDAIPPFERVREQVLRRQIEDARRLALPANAGAGRNASEVQALEKALQDEEALRLLYEEDNDKQRQEIQRIRGERDQLREERDSLRARTFYLEERVRNLNADQLGERETLPPSFPETWDNLEDWCEQHLGNLVALTPRAFRAARDSVYLDIPFAYEVLLFLAETYVPSRRGKLASGSETLEAEKARLGIDISPVGRAASERRSKETYSTTYKGKRVNLDMHVKGSNDRDPRHAFRIYFHWYELDERVIVGWLPSHLDNVMT